MILVKHKLIFYQETYLILAKSKCRVGKKVKKTASISLKFQKLKIYTVVNLRRFLAILMKVSLKEKAQVHKTCPTILIAVRLSKSAQLQLFLTKLVSIAN